MDEDEVVALVRRYRQLHGVKAEIEAEMNDINKRIKDAHDIGWSINVDGVECSKRAGRRQFSLSLAVSTLTPEEREKFKVTMFDAKAVREYIEEQGRLDECMEDAGNDAQLRLR